MAIIFCLCCNVTCITNYGSFLYELCARIKKTNINE
jgi:hypothetical protein